MKILGGSVDPQGPLDKAQNEETILLKADHTINMRNSSEYNLVSIIIFISAADHLPMAADQPTLLSHQSPTEPLLPSYYSPRSYLLLPPYPVFCLRLRRRRRRRNLCCFSCSVCVLSNLASFLILLLASSLLLLLWPSDPTVRVTHLHLKHLHISAPPRVALDLTLKLNLNVHNPDFFALHYRSLVSSVSYRGKHLGSVNAAGGTLQARGRSDLEAELQLDGVRVVDELVYLIEDLRKGSVPLDTVTDMEGSLGVIFADIPVKGNISCSLNVNPKSQKIVRQDCYPE